MVLDASGAVEFLLNTAAGKRLATRLADDSEVVHAPHLIDLEIAQVLRRYTRHGTLHARSGALALARWRDLDVQRYSHEPFSIGSGNSGTTSPPTTRCTWRWRKRCPRCW